MDGAVLFARLSANQSIPHTLESILRVQMFPCREQTKEFLNKKNGVVSNRGKSASFFSSWKIIFATGFVIYSTDLSKELLHIN